VQHLPSNTAAKHDMIFSESAIKAMTAFASS
jgi:hypothetical protein